MSVKRLLHNKRSKQYPKMADVNRKAYIQKVIERRNEWKPLKLWAAKTVPSIKLKPKNHGNINPAQAVRAMWLPTLSLPLPLSAGALAQDDQESKKLYVSDPEILIESSTLDEEVSKQLYVSDSEIQTSAQHEFCVPTTFDDATPAAMESWQIPNNTHSNNVGELLAVVYALALVTLMAVSTRCTLHCDSKIAANNTLGIWKNTHHKQIMTTAQSLYLSAARKCKVTVNKIAAHTNVAGNDAADTMAKLGANGTTRLWSPFHLDELVACTCNPSKRLRSSSRTNEPQSFLLF